MPMCCSYTYMLCVSVFMLVVQLTSVLESAQYLLLVLSCILQKSHELLCIDEN